MNVVEGVFGLAVGSWKCQAIEGDGLNVVGADGNLSHGQVTV